MLMKNIFRLPWNNALSLFCESKITAFFITHQEKSPFIPHYVWTNRDIMDK